MLEYNCFTMLWSALQMSQLHVFMYLLLVEGYIPYSYMNRDISSFIYPPSLPPRSPQSAELSSPCDTAGSHELPVSHTVVCTWQGYRPNLPHPPFPWFVHMTVPWVCISVPALQTGSSVPSFESLLYRLK